MNNEQIALLDFFRQQIGKEYDALMQEDELDIGEMRGWKEGAEWLADALFTFLPVRLQQQLTAHLIESQASLDLKAMSDKVDAVLEAETPDSMRKWLDEKRASDADPDRDLVERMTNVIYSEWGKTAETFGDFFSCSAQACAAIAEQRINAIKAEYEQQISNLLAQARETQFGRFEP